MKKLLLLLLPLFAGITGFSQETRDHRSETSSHRPPPLQSIPSLDESLPVFRIQVRLVTGNGENDDTDKEVYIKLNNADQEYYLDYGPDDFERNADKKYDVISRVIKKISDIQFIEIGAKGDDVWGIKKVELYINNASAPVFSSSFNVPKRINGSGNWPRKVVYTAQQIRNNPNWQRISTDEKIKKPSPLITADVIKSMVESMVGNQLHYNGNGKLFWGNTSGVNTVWGDHVEMKRKDGNTLHFDLDLEAEITGQNPEVDVNFDLVFNCESNGMISVKTANEKVGCHFDLKLFSASCETARKVYNGVVDWFGFYWWHADDFRTKGNTFSANFAIGGDGYQCKGVQVTPKGDVLIY